MAANFNMTAKNHVTPQNSQLGINSFQAKIKCVWRPLIITGIFYCCIFLILSKNFISHNPPYHTPLGDCAKCHRGAWCHSGVTLVSLRCWCYSGVTPVLVLLRCHSGAGAAATPVSLQCWCYSGVTPVLVSFQGWCSSSFATTRC